MPECTAVAKYDIELRFVIDLFVHSTGGFLV